MRWLAIPTSSCVLWQGRTSDQNGRNEVLGQNGRSGVLGVGGGWKNGKLSRIEEEEEGG